MGWYGSVKERSGICETKCVTIYVKNTHLFPAHCQILAPLAIHQPTYYLRLNVNNKLVRVAENGVLSRQHKQFQIPILHPLAILRSRRGLFSCVAVGDLRRFEGKCRPNLGIGQVPSQLEMKTGDTPTPKPQRPK